MSLPSAEQLSAPIPATPLRPWEQWLIHSAYLAGLGIVARILAGLIGVLPHASVLIALQLIAALGGMMFIYLRWTASGRAGVPPAWFVSHVLWLMMSFLFTVAWALGAAIFFFLALLVVMSIPAVGAVAVYGPVLVVVLIMLWFTYRMVRGYGEYLRGYPAGDMLPR